MGKKTGFDGNTNPPVGRLVVLSGGAKVSKLPDRDSGMTAGSRPARSERMEMMEKVS
jgi:hypothetical protein